MSSGRGGGGGLLKSREEDFARHLQKRLRTLSESEDTSWTAVNSSSDSDIFYDINSSLESPDEEVAEPIFIASQNQDSFTLERSDSSGSQYFDTVENLDDLSPGSPVSTKRIPILLLKTDRAPAVPNGHLNHIDDNSGCRRLSEMPYLEFKDQSYEVDNVGDGCDRCLLEEEAAEVEETDVKLEPSVVNSCDVNTVEVDTRQNDDGLSREYAEEMLETTDNSFCVFCDIEQIKSSISDNSAEGPAPSNEEITNNPCKSSEQMEISEKHHVEHHQSPKYNSSSNANNEDGVSLADLLQVLKKEISEENEPVKDESTVEISDDSAVPVIEVRESSPSAAGTKIRDDGEEYDIEIKRKNFRRCSSLKSGKTPPGTPGRKKIVRFADVFGLDLADVKTFLDEVPTVPKSAFEDLHGIEMSSSPVAESVPCNVTILTPQQEKILTPLFQQPISQPNFLDRVRENNVCLENAFVSNMSLFAISGVVRVKNVDFHKSVYVRYSIDKWRSFSDLQARYIPDSCDGFSDKFSFTLYAHTLQVGQRLEFAVRFHTAGSQFWDSNGGINYIFECTTYGPIRTYVDPSIPPSPLETWASFY